MSIITLISDWNSDDFYIGAVKGQILRNCPNANIIDITHRVTLFNVGQAGFILRNTYKNFPDGTIHIIAVNSIADKQQAHLLVEADNQYFIGADNGIFDLIFDKPVSKIIKIRKIENELHSFPEIKIFVKVAEDIIKGKKLKEIGSIQKKFKRQLALSPVIEDSVILGSVIYIDSYKNIFTNISVDLFNRVRKNRNFTIYVQSNRNRINEISDHFNNVAEGELVAIFNSINLMEIAIRKGKAAELFGLNINSTIRIKFYDNTDSENDIQGFFKK